MSKFLDRPIPLALTALSVFGLVLIVVGNIVAWSVINPGSDTDPMAQADEYVIFYGLLNIALAVGSLLTAVFGFLMPTDKLAVQYAITLFPLIGITLVGGISDEVVSTADSVRRAPGSNNERLAALCLQMIGSGMAVIPMIVGLLFFGSSGCRLRVFSWQFILAGFSAITLCVGTWITWDSGVHNDPCEGDPRFPPGLPCPLPPQYLCLTSPIWFGIVYALSAAVRYREGMYVATIFALSKYFTDFLPVGGLGTPGGTCDLTQDPPIDTTECKAGFGIIWVGSVMLLITSLLYFYKEKQVDGDFEDDAEPGED